LIKTSLSCSVAEAEAAPAAVENEQEPKNRLIAQNIPWDAKEDDMKALFGKHGTVVHVEVLVICQFLDFEKFCC
jgi:RNA recognition motif-containing protein